MIPVFVALAIYYGESVRRGDPQEWQRFAAIIIFLLAAASDGLDGYVARRYNQRSQLGVILDPIADKLLVGAALFMLAAFARISPTAISNRRRAAAALRAVSSFTSSTARCTTSASSAKSWSCRFSAASTICRRDS